MLSIAKMVEFQLPLEGPTAPDTHPPHFFSMAAPAPMNKDLVLRLRHLPIPEANVIYKCDAESDNDAPQGRGQRKKIIPRCYPGPAWMEH
jgi:hypothetical protein